MSKNQYVKKYGVFVWIKDSDNSPARLISLGDSMSYSLSKNYAKVYYKSSYIHCVLNYHINRVKNYSLNTIGKPFLVRITGSKVKMKTGTLKLKWKDSEKVLPFGHLYVPFEFVPN